MVFVSFPSRTFARAARGATCAHSRERREGEEKNEGSREEQACDFGQVVEARESEKQEGGEYAADLDE